MSFDQEHTRKRVTQPEGGRLMTKQAAKDGADINKILKKYEKTGLMPQSGMQPRYGDFTGANSYHENLNQLIEAQALFEF